MKISKTKISTVIIFYLRIFILVKLLFFYIFFEHFKRIWNMDIYEIYKSWIHDVNFCG